MKYSQHLFPLNFQVLFSFCGCSKESSCSFYIKNTIPTILPYPHEPLVLIKIALVLSVQMFWHIIVRKSLELPLCNSRLAGICCSYTNLWWEWSWVHKDFSWQYGDDTAPSSHLTGESYTCWASSSKSCSVSGTLHIVQKFLHLMRANRTTDLLTIYILVVLKYSTGGNFLAMSHLI